MRIVAAWILTGCLFTHEDATFQTAGAVGLCCKPNNVTCCDDPEIESEG